MVMRKRSRKLKLDRYNWFDYINILFMLVIVAVTLFPFINILAMSFSSDSAIYSGKVGFFPVEFNLEAYKLVLSNHNFFISYGNSLLYMFLNVAVGLAMTILCAYPLSKDDLVGKGVIMKFITVTMFFSGGIIPNYLLVKALGLRNSIWSLVIPGAIGVYNMIIMRTFFKSIPKSLIEAAQVSGMSDFGILVKIVLPLSKSIIATIALYIAVWSWNSWFQALIYIDSNEKVPLTLFLRNIINGSQLSASNMPLNAEDVKSMPAESLKSAAIMLTSGLILLLYPFVQKYFVTGVMVGSVKE